MTSMAIASFYSLHSHHNEVKHLELYLMIFLLRKKRIQADTDNDRIHIKDQCGLFCERLAQWRSQGSISKGSRINPGLFQESMHKGARKQKTSHRLVCLEFPPSPCIRALGIEAQYPWRETPENNDSPSESGKAAFV